MSQYNKTVLTRAGLELAKRANAGQAKFGITRAVTSADDWSHKTVQDLEEVTTIPNIMQQGTIMDANEVESNNSVIGVSLCFTNKNLSTGYQIRIIGLYVKEEGQKNDFLYAVTTAITPEYMPSFADKVLYRFNMQMYCVIGKTQAVNVVIDDGTAVTHGQFDKYKDEINKSIEAVAEAHTEDMKKVVKSATINGGAKVTPDGDGNLALVVPDPDLSDLAHKSELIPKADKTYVDDKVDAIDFSKIKFRKQYVNGDGNKVDKTWSATKNDDGTYTIDLFNDDWTASKLADVLAQLPNKVDTSTFNAQVQDAKNTAQSSDNQIWSEVNKLSGKQTVDKADANSLTASGTYYISNPAKNFPVVQWGNLFVSNGNSHRTSQLYFPDDGDCFWFRVLCENSWRNWIQVADKANITNLQNQINNNDKATITTGFDWNSASPNNETRSIQDAWLVDQDALHGGVTRMNSLQDQINQKLQFIQGQDSYDVLAIDGFAGIIEFNNRANLKNLPPMGNKTWTYILKLLRDNWGTVLVYSQDNTVWQNALNGTTWSGWVRLATSSDVNSLQNLINQQNQTIQSLTTRLTNAENEIRYIKANYVEGRRFSASQEAQANSWENENPQRIAFIER